MADMIYLNLQQENREDNTEAPIRLADDRTSSILEDPGVWNVSLVNFGIKASTLPLLWWDSGAHSVSLRYTAGGGAPIVYTQEVLYADTRGEAATYGTQWVWTPNEIINQMNIAFAAAYAAMSAANPIAATAGPIVSIENGLCVIRVQTELLAEAEITCNERINLLFLGMTPYERLIPIGAVLSPTDAAVQYRWPIPINVLNVYDVGTPAIEYVSSSQVRPTVASWYRAKQLYFRVGGLSVGGELMPSGDASSSNASASLLTNFHATGTAQLEGDGLTYFVSGSHRWYSLRHSGPLQSLAVTVFWADSGGSAQHPVTLAKGESAVARLLFRRKTLGLG